MKLNILTAEGGEVAMLHFAHSIDETTRHGERQITHCTFHFGPCPKNERPCEHPVRGEGTAIFNPNDRTFRKHTGRNVALLRAMKALSVPRDLRAQVWAAYLQRVRVPGGARGAA